MVFNSLHGNNWNKPRACLFQGRCTTSSGPPDVSIVWEGGALADVRVAVVVGIRVGKVWGCVWNWGNLGLGLDLGLGLGFRVGESWS